MKKELPFCGDAEKSPAAQMVRRRNFPWIGGDRMTSAWQAAAALEDVDLHRDPPRGDGADGDDDLTEMNAIYAVVKIGGRTRVMSFEDSPVHRHCKVPVFARVQDFLSFNLKRKKKVIDAKGNERKVGIGRWWFDHDDRAQYDEVLYAPGVPVRKGVFNLWRGFSCTARRGDCSLYLEHLRENICSGVDWHYQYLLNWMARGVQYPERHGEIAVVLRGQEGTGKGIFAKTYGGLFGPHFWH